MPAYGTKPPTTLQSGYPSVVWNQENVAVGAASLAVNMRRYPNLPNVLSVEVLFDANPGAFAVDLQVADTDEEKYDVTESTLDEGLNSTFCGRLARTELVAKFVRLKMVSLGNAVKVTARVF